MNINDIEGGMTIIGPSGNHYRVMAVNGKPPAGRPNVIAKQLDHLQDGCVNSVLTFDDVALSQFHAKPEDIPGPLVSKEAYSPNPGEY